MRVYYLLPCFCYIFIIAVIEKEVEIVGTKKTETKNKHRVTQNLVIQYITKSSKINGYQTNQ